MASMSQEKFGGSARMPWSRGMSARLAAAGAILLAIVWIAWVMVFSERVSIGDAQAEERLRQEQLRQQFPESENAEAVHMPGHHPPT